MTAGALAQFLADIDADAHIVVHRLTPNRPLIDIIVDATREDLRPDGWFALDATADCQPVVVLWPEET
jgi:hypothetical protein